MTTSSTEGPTNQQLAAECRELAAKLEAFPGTYEPPVEQQIALLRQEAHRARILAVAALTVAVVAVLLAWLT